jgi:hypothetical protein
LCEGDGQRFERDFAFEPAIFGQINLAHSTSTEQADDLVMPDAAPDRGFIAIVRERHGLRQDRRVNEAAVSLVRGEQPLGLLAQLLVVAAHLRQMGCPRFALKLQRLVEPQRSVFFIAQVS